MGKAMDWEAFRKALERFQECLDARRVPAFGQDMRQPEGFNPPPLELRSPEPKQGQML